VQSQQAKLEVTVVGEAQASRFITLIFRKESLEKADNPLSLQLENLKDNIYGRQLSVSRFRPAYGRVLSNRVQR
jgi:hypothetical protein